MDDSDDDPVVEEVHNPARLVGGCVTGGCLV